VTRLQAISNNRVIRSSSTYGINLGEIDHDDLVCQNYINVSYPYRC